MYLGWVGCFQNVLEFDRTTSCSTEFCMPVPTHSVTRSFFFRTLLFRTLFGCNWGKPENKPTILGHPHLWKTPIWLAHVGVKLGHFAPCHHSPLWQQRLDPTRTRRNLTWCLVGGVGIYWSAYCGSLDAQPLQKLGVGWVEPYELSKPAVPPNNRTEHLHHPFSVTPIERIRSQTTHKVLIRWCFIWGNSM